MSASKPDAWMPLYIADYLRDTMHLTTEQHGAYMLLIMACWTRGGSLPRDPAQLAGIARMTPAAWKKAAPLILAFFTVDGDSLTHKRISAEAEKARRMVEARRTNGQKGGRPRKLDETEEKPRGFSQANLDQTPARVALPSPSTSDLEPDGPKSEVVVVERERAPEDWPKSDPVKALIAEMACPWLDPDKSQGLILTAGRLQAWKLAGASWEFDVLPVVRSACAKAKKAIGTWTYFDAAVAQSIADNRRALEIPEAAARPQRGPSLVDQIGQERAEARRLALSRMEAANG